MAKPRKSWQPKYRFGGNKADWCMPNELGKNQSPWHPVIKKPKSKKR